MAIRKCGKRWGDVYQLGWDGAWNFEQRTTDDMIFEKEQTNTNHQNLKYLVLIHTEWTHSEAECNYFTTPTRSKPLVGGTNHQCFLMPSSRRCTSAWLWMRTPSVKCSSSALPPWNRQVQRSLFSRKFRRWAEPNFQASWRWLEC